jgi:hypothetical protein
VFRDPLVFKAKQEHKAILDLKVQALKDHKVGKVLVDQRVVHKVLLDRLVLLASQ